MFSKQKETQAGNSNSSDGCVRPLRVEQSIGCDDCHMPSGCVMTCSSMVSNEVLFTMEWRMRWSGLERNVPTWWLPQPLSRDL